MDAEAWAWEAVRNSPKSYKQSLFCSEQSPTASSFLVIPACGRAKKSEHTLRAGARHEFFLAVIGGGYRLKAWYDHYKQYRILECPYGAI
eukprot:scaffold18913_cov111-Isochrysis_galbana.AAC.3